MIEFEKKVLNNGLRVFAAPMKNTEAVTLLVLVGVGSRYETKKLNGISHFLEHLFFKGTKNRPRAGEVFKELDRMGASYNAFTSKENTGFWVKSSVRDFDESLDIVSDILQESIFKEEEIEKERGVILQEISMYEDEPRKKVLDVIENVVYGDQPVGWDIIGTKENVRVIRRADIIDFKLKNYFSKNIVIVVAGGIDEKIIFQKVEKAFSRLDNGKNKSYKKALVFQKAPNVKILQKDSDQTHFAIAARGYSMFDERRYALNILSVILGGNMSSRLFVEIREKLGLAYYVYAFGDQYADCGYLGMAAGIPHEKLKKVIGKITDMIGGIKKKGISKKDLDFAKGFVRGQMALRLESTDEIASFIAGQELFYKKIMQPEEIIKKIEKVSRDDILKVAGDIFQPNKINMAVIGCQKDTAESAAFYKKLFSNL
jgi:predicted Zn-dependent peptidase